MRASTCRFTCSQTEAGCVVSIPLCVCVYVCVWAIADEHCDPLSAAPCASSSCILCCQAGSGCKVSTSDVIKCRMSALTTSVFMAPHPLHKVLFRALLSLVGWNSKLSLSCSIMCLASFHFYSSLDLVTFSLHVFKQVCVTCQLSYF